MKAKTTVQELSAIARSALAAALTAGILLVPPTTPARAAYSGAGYALDFDGSAGYVEVPDNASLDANLGDSFTVEAWIRTREDDDNMIFAKHSGGSFGSYYFATLSGGELCLTVITHAGRKNHIVSYVYNDGRWHHVAGVYDGSGLRIYVDGVQIGGTTAQSGIVKDTSYPVRIGYYEGSPSWFYYGTYDEIRLWDYARTVAEIRAHAYKELSGDEAGLVAYYEMSDGSGTFLADDSSNSNTGELFDGPAWVTSGAFAGSRNALNFDDDGSQEHVLVSNGSALIANQSALTMECWVYPHTLVITDVLTDSEGLVSIRNDTDADFYLTRTATGSVEGRFRNSTGTPYTVDAPITPDKWQHYALVHNGCSLRIYRNGILAQSTGASGQITNATQPMHIGEQFYSSYSSPLDGLIDEVRIWTTARTADQIRENMFRTLDGDESGLVAYYRFDQYNASDQTTLYNLVSDSYHGTLTNMEAASDWASSSAFNTWIGSDSTDWATGSNWSTASVPASTDNVGIYTWAASYPPDLDTTATVDGLVVGTGVTLSLNSNANLTVSAMDFVYGSVSRAGGAISGETRTAASGTITQTYGLADAAIAVQTPGSLTSLQARRTESPHPNENANGGGAYILDRYYTFTPTGSGYTAELCLGYTDAELGGLNESHLRLCRWTGSAWSCHGRGVNSNTTTNWVSADGVTAFSDWVIGAVGPSGGIPQPPVADAGADQTVNTQATVTLDGSGSSDPDADYPLTYYWAQTGSPAVAFTPNLSVTTFTAPSDPTVLTFTLAVTDSLGLADPTPDTVVVTVQLHRIYLPLVMRR
jgi:hypothetical protein